MVLVSEFDGTVERVVGEEIVIRDQQNKPHVYQLMKYVRSNQDTCINQNLWFTKATRLKQVM